MSNYDKIIKKALMGAGIGAGILGAGKLAGEGTLYTLSKLNDYPDDPAYNMYKEGKTIDEIKSSIGELDPEVLHTLLNTEDYLQTLAKDGGEDLETLLRTSKYIDDKSIYRILNELRGE